MMGAYDDMVQFARDCMRHAQMASSKEVADELERTALEYREKAAKLNGGKLANFDVANFSIQGQKTSNLPMKLLSLAKHGFMAYWYFYVRTLNSIWPSITLDGKTFVIFPNVYKPLENEHACSEYCREGDRVLDMGCGSGVGTVFCAPKAREVIAVDISAAALKNTEANCRLHGLQNVKVVRSDMFSQVDGKFDLIVANSPYIEDEFKTDDHQFATSTRYMPTLFAQAGDYLADGGRLLIQFPLRSRARIEKLASEHTLEVVTMRPLPSKSLRLALWSALYMQVGFSSTYYLLQQQPNQSHAVKDQATSQGVPLAAA
jgi:release factor glutamine methyltransferase